LSIPKDPKNPSIADRNRSTPPEVIEALLGTDEAKELRAVMEANPRVTQAVADLIGHKTPESATPQDVLEALTSGDVPDDLLDKLVDVNPNPSKEVLDRLANADEFADVREALAGSPTISQEVLDKLTEGAAPPIGRSRRTTMRRTTSTDAAPEAPEAGKGTPTVQGPMVKGPEIKGKNEGGLGGPTL
jgi:hypothetical protein